MGIEWVSKPRRGNKVSGWRGRGHREGHHRSVNICRGSEVTVLIGAMSGFFYYGPRSRIRGMGAGKEDPGGQRVSRTLPSALRGAPCPAWGTEEEEGEVGVCP